MYIGEIAALATSLLFSATSTIFTLAGRKVGSVVLNRIRLIFALGWLVFAHLLLGIALPLHIEPERWLWLGLSGVVGLAIGDYFLFQAFVAIGPRLGMLMMALAPILSTMLAWLFLGEVLSVGQSLGILVTLAGVAWVVMERSGGRAESDRHSYWVGILFGLGAAAGQALGLILAKKGLGGDFPALSGTLIRMVAAALVIWTMTLAGGQAGATFRGIAARPRVVGLILAGAFVGPFMGVTFSLVAIQHTAVGVASTLMALPPVILLPVGYFFFQERFGWQAVAGTLLAVSGVALLFLV